MLLDGTYDNTEFWIEEHGLIMEKPDFPLPPGKYVVTGGREITTVLTISDDGDSWSLDDGARLHDVTHLPCRSARYKPDLDSAAASAASARPEDFPVTPGGAMPDVAQLPEAGLLGCLPCKLSRKKKKKKWRRHQVFPTFDDLVCLLRALAGKWFGGWESFLEGGGGWFSFTGG